MRALIPGVLDGHDAQDIVTAKADYSKLDEPGAAVRLRLNQIVVRARNAPSGVEIAYTRASGGGAVTRVKAKNCVLASWNMMIPYLCPEMPAPQKTALHQLVKTPLVYTSVALRDWESLQEIGHPFGDGAGRLSFRLSLEPAGQYRQLSRARAIPPRRC